MALSLYRRHRVECEAGRPEDSRTAEYQERQKGFKGRCRCQIHASGTLGGRFSRRRTDTHEWEKARAWAAALETVGSWKGSAPAAAPVVASENPVRTTVADAIKVFLANRQGANLAHPTYRKYVTFTRQLQAFADARGFVMLDQFTTSDVDMFYSASKLGVRAKGKMLGTLRAFWRFAVNRAWIAKTPVSPDLKQPVGASRAVNKAPFTDEQLADIFSACESFNDFSPARWGNRHGSGVWTGEDLKEFIWLMTHTGLRISDVVLFDIARLQGNDVFLRTKKTGGEVFTYIPDWLRDRLLARAKRLGSQPFMIGGAKRLDTVIDIWRTRLGKVFDHADVGEERATPHRFRHTFARILLQRGVPVSDVAELLGDDEKTVRTHYFRWVPEKQQRLTRILKDAFRDKPNLVGLKGGRPSRSE